MIKYTEPVVNAKGKESWEGNPAHCVCRGGAQPEEGNSKSIFHIAAACRIGD